MVNTPQISINATTFGRFTTKARKNVTILVNDTSASYYIILCRYFTTRARGIFHCYDNDESRDDDLCARDEICRSSPPAVVLMTASCHQPEVKWF